MATDSITTRDRSGVRQLRVVSFGFGHEPAEPGDLTLDLRDWFRDPHVSPELRALTGRDFKVIGSVLSTPGVGAFIDRLFRIVAELVHLGLGTVTVVVGCVGGRHRSVVIADQVYFRARSAGWVAEVRHRDIDKPVLKSRRKATAVDSAPAAP